MRLSGKFMYGDIGFWTHIHTGAALAVEIVQTLETSLQDKSVDNSYNTFVVTIYLAACAVGL